MEPDVLMIVFEDPMPNGVSAWVATVQNGGLMIPFAGETIEEQQGAIAALANRMRAYQGDLAAFEEEIAVVLDLPEEMTAAEAFQVMFAETGTLFYDTEVVFEVAAVGVDVLAECLADAGAALLLAL